MKSYIYLVILILLAVFVRLFAVFELKQNFSNDESVTYLSATGNQVRYAELVKPDSNYIDHLTVTNIWKNCYQPNPKFCFGKIANDLTQYDIHPPLYFWLIHVFILIFGLHLYTGLILNLLITIFTLWALFRLSYFILNNQLHAIMVCTFWFLSPAVVQMDLEARHYQLLALFTILLTYSSLLIIKKEELSKKNILSVVLLSALGMLTHYYFMFIMIGVFILFFWRFKFSIVLAKIVAAFVGGFCLFLLIFPQFIDFIKNYLLFKKGVHHVNEYQSFTDKIKTQLFASLDFGAYGHLLKYIYLVLLIVFIIIVVSKLINNKKLKSFSFSNPILAILLLFLWNVFFTVMLYLCNISPNQAVGEQYYSYIWPFIAILLVYAIRYIKVSVYITLFYLTVLFVFFIQSVKNSPYVKREILGEWYTEANKADLLVIDTYDRCLLPRTLYFIGNDKKVFVGDIKKMKEDSTFKKVVVFYLINDKKTVDHQPLSGYELIKKEKYLKSENHPYFMESYKK